MLRGRWPMPSIVRDTFNKGEDTILPFFIFRLPRRALQCLSLPRNDEATILLGLSHFSVIQNVRLWQKIFPYECLSEIAPAQFIYINVPVWNTFTEILFTSGSVFISTSKVLIQLPWILLLKWLTVLYND